MFEESFLQDKLGFDASAKLDLSKLILGGHSFGGITAISLAEKEKRVRAVFSFDPWFWAKDQNIGT